MSKAESAELILKLYDLRREAKMREARKWMATFFPESVQDIMQTVMNPETSEYYRMVVSYWDMAAGFVNHGAIDEQMFVESGGEYFMVFSKVEPFLAQMRETTGYPNMLANLEKLAMRQPDAAERLVKSREAQKRWAAAAKN